VVVTLLWRDPLNRQVEDAEIVEVAPEASPESVPAVPLD
jgi:hypothetical protein